jgi:hypothetical protein
MQENKGLGAVGYRFSARIIKEEAMCYDLAWKTDPSSTIWADPQSIPFSAILAV